jgi:hypothetical protein
MKIFEVEDRPGSSPTPSPDQLLGLVQFLNGRAQDQAGTKQISQDTFINLAQSLGINVTPDNLGQMIDQEPLSNVLEPLDPNSGIISFKGAEIEPGGMPVNQAQDVVAAAAKKAASKDRGI